MTPMQRSWRASESCVLVDQEAMHQFWDTALNRFKAYVESGEANARRSPPDFDAQRPSDRAEGGK
jgi:hypothetical protein